MIMIFVSSLHENVKLAHRIEKKLNDVNYKTKIINLVELDLPMYDTNKEQNEGIPQKALDLAKEMETASGYIFVSPEYNFSAPPVLLNMIAWISRIGDNFRALFALKKIQLASHSGANGVDFLNTFRNQLTKLGAIVMPRDIITSYTVTIEDDSLEKILDQYYLLLKG